MRSRGSIAAALELALYLRRLSARPGISEVLSHIRSSPQFEGALLQLALAYRLDRSGVLGLVFEPDADDGRKADIGFRYQGENYLVECYDPASSHEPELDDLVNHTLSKIIDSSDVLEHPVVVRIELFTTENLNAKLRKRLQHDVHQLTGRLKGRRREELITDSYLVEIFDGAGIPVEQLKELAWSFSRPGAFVVHKKEIPRRQVEQLRRGMPTKENPGSWAVLTIRDDPRADVDVDRLLKLIERKVPQVRRRARGVRGVIAVQTHLAGEAAFRRTVGMEFVTKLRQRILAVRPELAAICLVGMGLREAKPWFGGAGVGGPQGSEFMDLWERIGRLEEKSNLLMDWLRY